MKLKNPEFIFDIRIELAEGGFHVTAPVIVESSLSQFGVDTGPEYQIRKFVVTSKEELLKLIGATVDDLYA